jgi:transposase
MRTPKSLPEEVVSRLPLEMKKARSKSEFQRLQCVWLRASLGLSSKQVAVAVGWHPCSVRRVQAHFLREGEASLTRGGRGGRRRENLTLQQEEALLQEFLASSGKGGILEVSRIKAAYENLLGRQVPHSTVYRMLARHGWRKITPRPRHPKAEASAQAEFKKTTT